MSSDQDLLRAREWVFHFLRGNVSEAVRVERSGARIRPAQVIAAVVGLLADEGLVLMPMSVEAQQLDDERV